MNDKKPSLPNVIKIYEHLEYTERDQRIKEGEFLLRLQSDRYAKVDRPLEQDEDYCWQCGHVDLKMVFLANDYCPSRNCTNPSNWRD